MNDKQRAEKAEAKKALSSLAWSMARAMTKRQFDRSLCNIHVWCPTCQHGYCLGFDGKDQFCDECPYKPYEIDGKMCNCTKECTGSRICQSCEEVEHAKARDAKRRKRASLLRLQKKHTIWRAGHRRK